MDDLVDVWGNGFVLAKLEGINRNRAVFEIIIKKMTKYGHPKVRAK